MSKQIPFRYDFVGSFLRPAKTHRGEEAKYGNIPPTRQQGQSTHCGRIEFF